MGAFASLRLNHLHLKARPGFLALTWNSGDMAVSSLKAPSHGWAIQVLAEDVGALSGAGRWTEPFALSRGWSQVVTSPFKVSKPSQARGNM